MVVAFHVAVARWEDVPGERLHQYWQRLREAGLEPVDVWERGQPLEGCAGLVLTGGVDVDPRLYGAEPGQHTQDWNRERDDFELGLLSEALRRDMPVLAICRGLQLLNVCFGGGLLQHIESGEHMATDDAAHSSRWHDVSVAYDSRLLAPVYGSGKQHVNSRHHQAVTRDALGKGLRVAALSDDGMVEGLESESHAWAAGVQWHPERPEPEVTGFAESSRRLFAAFARAVGKDVRAQDTRFA